MNFKKQCAQVVATTCAFLLFCLFISPALSQAKTNKAPLRKVTLQLKWTHQFQFAGFYAAKAKGYYQEAGLDVALIPRTAGVEVLTEVMEGRAQFGVGNSELLINYAKGIPVVALGAIFQHAPNIILTKAESNITHPRDLRGKQLMVEDTTAAAQWAMLASQGVQREDVILQKLEWTTDSLINDETDAMSAYLTDQPYDLKRIGIPVNILRPLAFGIDFYGDTLFSTAQLANEDPELVEAFLSASYKGWEYAMANTDEIIGLIRNQYETEKTIGQLSYEANAMHELILPTLVEIGTMSRKRWEQIAGSFRSLGMLETPVQLDNFIYIPKHQRELISLAQWAPYLSAGTLVLVIGALLLLLFNRQLKRNVNRRTREVEDSRRNLRQVLDLVPNMIYVKDREGRFLLLNRSMAESLGSTEEALTGVLHSDVHKDKDEADRMAADDLSVFETGVPKVSMEEPYRHADGTTHWIQSTRLPFTLADSDEDAVITLSVDITHRRKTEAAMKESEERFRAIFNQTYQFSAILTLSGDLIQLNETAIDAFQQKREDVLGKQFRHAAWWSQEPEIQNWLAKAVVMAGQGEIVRRDIENLLPDGTAIHVDFTLKPARNEEGEILFLIAEGRNISKLKKSEEELRRLNEELEERVIERTRKLQDAKGELEASLQELQKTQEELILSEKLAALGGLVAGVAHEINTPLGVGVTASSYLNEKINTVETQFGQGQLKKSDLEKFIQTGQESCSTILTNLNRAAELIKSFKQVAADQSSEISRDFNLKAYVDEVLISLKPKYKRTGHTIENNCQSIELNSYPGAFMQIITNLLLNALTHGYGENEYGKISIGGQVKGDKLFFSFDDDGIGIEPELLDKVFEPFYTTKRGQGGTGLGLHIVFNTVTQALNGTINIESKPGGGTHFAITIPLSNHQA